jgi:hypothetical protein
VTRKLAPGLAFAVAVGAAAVAGCGGATVRGASRGDAIFYIDTDVTDAGLYVDGTFIGDMRSLRGGVSVKPGEHRVEVRHDDYFAYYAELALKAGERRRVKVDLAPVLP